MKIILSILAVTISILPVFCQQKFSVGVDAFSIYSQTKNINKQNLFKKDLGIQVGFRKNINNDNFLTLSIGATKSNESIYSMQRVKFGYEVGNLFNIKSWFIITELSLNNFRHTNTRVNKFTIAPSLGMGFNIKVIDNLLLRVCNNVEYQLPNSIGSFFNNTNVGFHYTFTKK